MTNLENVSWGNYAGPHLNRFNETSDPNDKRFKCKDARFAHSLCHVLIPNLCNHKNICPCHLHPNHLWKEMKRVLADTLNRNVPLWSTPGWKIVIIHFSSLMKLMSDGKMDQIISSKNGWFSLWVPVICRHWCQWAGRVCVSDLRALTGLITSTVKHYSAIYCS